MLRIFLYGTLPAPTSPEFQNIIDFLRDAGEEFAKRGHSLVVVSSVEKVVERYVLEGAEKVPGGCNVIVCRSNDPEFSFDQRLFVQSNFSFIKNQGQLNNSHINAIQRCDVVLTVSGTHALDPQIGYQADIMGKPILPIPFFGAGAKLTWDFISGIYNAKGYLDDDEVDLLENTGSTPSIAVMVDLIEKIEKRHKTLPKGGLSALTLFCSAVSLIGLWSFFFLRPNFLEDSNRSAFFIMVLAAAVLGVILRLSRSILIQDSLIVSGRKFLSELTSGLIIAFLFSLLWMVNNFVVTGDKVFDISNVNTFSRVALTCSLIAGSAAFFLEDSFKKLKSVLS